MEHPVHFHLNLFIFLRDPGPLQDDLVWNPCKAAPGHDFLQATAIAGAFSLIISWSSPIEYHYYQELKLHLSRKIVTLPFALAGFQGIAACDRRGCGRAGPKDGTMIN
jgi:hypothetical protein